MALRQIKYPLLVVQIITPKVGKIINEIELLVVVKLFSQ